jgi:hypothetical protein
MDETKKDNLKRLGMIWICVLYSAATLAIAEYQYASIAGASKPEHG